MLHWFRRKEPLRQHAALPYASHIWVSRSLLEKTVGLLRKFRDQKEYHEGILYWAGVETPTQWWILSCIRPDAVTTPGSYRTSAVANSDVILAANRHGLHILAQVHSHPGGWVGHSGGDHQGAFMPFEGSLSVIVPEYGVHGMIPLERCGVHRFEQGQFRRLSNAETTELFRIVPLELSVNDREQ